MSEDASAPRRALHLVLESFPRAELAGLVEPSRDVEIFPLTEATAKEALEKIFAADTVAVWTNVR